MNKEMIHSLVDKVIKVDRGGPESRVGRLLAAEDDYFTLLHEDEGIIYYNTQHIKSVTYNSKSQLDLTKNSRELASTLKLKTLKVFCRN